MLVDEACLWDEWPERWGPDSRIDVRKLGSVGNVWYYGYRKEY